MSGFVDDRVIVPDRPASGLPERAYHLGISP